MHPVNQSFSNTGAEKQKIRNSFTYPGTYPGRRFPHVWLSILVPGNLVFTIDVARIEKFCLFTGTRGVRWERAAESIEKEWGLPITAVRIGRAQDWQDTYLHWEDKRAVEEDNAGLVRPNLLPGWKPRVCAISLRD
jgi:hypothetical protein